MRVVLNTHPPLVSPAHREEQLVIPRRENASAERLLPSDTILLLFSFTPGKNGAHTENG